MKFNLIILCHLFLCNCNNLNNDQPSETDTTIRFEKNTHDFGRLKMDSRVSRNFKVSNAGDHALLIHDIKSSCGCTVPEWPKQPIKKGESHHINVTFDASHPGVFRKSIIVHYNGAGSPDTLIIKGKVAFPENI